MHANYNGLMMDNMQTEAQPTRTRILNAAREI
ncbi:TetR family transcriptional regulator, partial [Shigella flexneri]